MLFISFDKHRGQMSEVQQCSTAVHPEVHTKPGCTLQASVGKSILPAQKQWIWYVLLVLFARIVMGAGENCHQEARDTGPNPFL